MVNSVQGETKENLHIICSINF